ncbi:MAG: YidC/Oxa1 family insertase periplasmic-domain containing protein [Planctomycetota bacterium]
MSAEEPKRPDEEAERGERSEPDGTPEDAAPAGPTGPGVDLRRLVITVALIVGGLGYFFWDEIRDVVKPPQITPRSAPADPDLPENDVAVRYGQLDVTFTPTGAAVKKLTWTAPDDDHTETLVAPTYESEGETHRNRAFAVRLPGSDEWAERAYAVGPVEDVTIDGGDGPPVRARSIVFRRQSDNGGITLVKQFLVRRDEPLIELLLKIEINRDGADHWLRHPEKGGAYTLTVCNAVGVPSDLGRGDPQIAVRADNVVQHHEVRRLSGTERWPGDEEKSRAAHGHGEGTPTLQWVANATRYFALIVIPRTGLYGAEMDLTRTASAGAAVDIEVPVPDTGDVEHAFHIYAGPKQYEELARLPGRPQEAIDYWYFGPATIRLLRWIHDHVVANYGVAIILFTIALRLVMWPVTAYNLRSMVDIKIANARLEDIDAREPPRSQARAHATWLKEARVWEKVQGRATFGVVLPLLILLPVLLILYHALRVGYAFHHQPFILWIDDITRRDPVFILPVLMGIGMMGQLRTMSENPAKERMWIFMPVAFTVLFAFFSAGLVLFWLTDVWLGWGQLALIRKAKSGGGKAHARVRKAEQRAAEIREGSDETEEDTDASDDGL